MYLMCECECEGECEQGCACTCDVVFGCCGMGGRSYVFGCLRSGDYVMLIPISWHGTYITIYPPALPPPLSSSMTVCVGWVFLPKPINL